MLRNGDLSFEIRMLISYMRSLSGDYHQVAWSENLEYDLWDIAETGQRTQEWPLSAQEINDLQKLREWAGGWVRYRELDEVLVDYGVDRWEKLEDNNHIIPEEKWYQVYTQEEWEAVMMERAL